MVCPYSVSMFMRQHRTRSAQYTVATRTRDVCVGLLTCVCKHTHTQSYTHKARHYGDARILYVGITIPRLARVCRTKAYANTEAHTCVASHHLLFVMRLQSYPIPAYTLSFSFGHRHTGLAGQIVFDRCCKLLSITLSD